MSNPSSIEYAQTAKNKESWWCGAEKPPAASNSKIFREFINWNYKCPLYKYWAVFLESIFKMREPYLFQRKDRFSHFWTTQMQTFRHISRRLGAAFGEKPERYSQFVNLTRLAQTYWLSKFCSIWFSRSSLKVGKNEPFWPNSSEDDYYLDK